MKNKLSLLLSLAALCLSLVAIFVGNPINKLFGSQSLKIKETGNLKGCSKEQVINAKIKFIIIPSGMEVPLPQEIIDDNDPCIPQEIKDIAITVRDYFQKQIEINERLKGMNLGNEKEYMRLHDEAYKQLLIQNPAYENSQNKQKELIKKFLLSNL